MVRRMRLTSASDIDKFMESMLGKSSRIDLVWIEVMTAQMEQLRELNHRASATQLPFWFLDHGSMASVAPAQNDAWRC
jgi:hypothetical protein